jgi:hypothetical protein
MKKLLALSLIVLLTGCFGPEKFDTSSEVTIKESTQKIVSALPEANREEFTKALMYFTMGGSDGFKSMMGAAFSGKSTKVSNEALVAVNLQKINGLNGEQILEKYKVNLEKDRIKREKKEEEQKKDRIKREKKEAERKKVKVLKNEAQELLDSNKFKEAIAKYKDLSEITSGVEAAESGIEKATKTMNEFTEKMNYIEKVTITEFSAKRIDTYSKKAVPAVRISLKNNGDRSLDKVKVIVYFQDKNGNTIFEEDYHPVLVSKYSSGSDNKPLKAGYVKEMEKGKYYTLDSALTDWIEGKSVAKVVDVEFSKS